MLESLFNKVIGLPVLESLSNKVVGLPVLESVFKKVVVLRPTTFLKKDSNTDAFLRNLRNF